MALQNIVAGAEASGLGLGFFGESWAELDALHAGYWFGDGWPMEDDAYDYALFERANTPVGAITRSAGSALLNLSGYYTLPFTDTEVLALGDANEITFAGIVKTAGANAQIISSFDTTTTAGLRIWCGNTGTIALYNSEGSADNDQVTIAATADNGNWEFIAGVITPTRLKLFRKGAATAMSSSVDNAPTTATVPGGARNFRVGRGYAAGDGGNIHVAGMAIYNRELTDDEVTACYLKARTFAATNGIAI
jgi:hypothetical protein